VGGGHPCCRQDGPSCGQELARPTTPANRNGQALASESAAGPWLGWTEAPRRNPQALAGGPWFAGPRAGGSKLPPGEEGTRKPGRVGRREQSRRRVRR
jgi:hypothetical protein